MAAKKSATTNTSPKARPGNRNNKTGKGGFGDRPQDVNRAGQRNKAAVQTQAQARAIYVQVLNEPFAGNAVPPKDATVLEYAIRKQVKKAMEGDTGELERILDRVWGKSTQPHELTGKDGEPIPVAFSFVPYAGNNSDDS